MNTPRSSFLRFAPPDTSRGPRRRAPRRRLRLVGVVLVSALVIAWGVGQLWPTGHRSETGSTTAQWHAGEISSEHSGRLRDVDSFVIAATSGVPHTVRLRATAYKVLRIGGGAGQELIVEGGSDVMREIVPSDGETLDIEVSGQLGPYEVCVESPGLTCRAPGVHRVAGPNPHSRSAELSSSLPTVPERAVLTTNSPVELMVAASLAMAERAPLLTLPFGGLSQPVALELIRLRPQNITIVGSTEMVPGPVIRAAFQYAAADDGQRVTTVSGDAVTIAATASQQFPLLTPVVYVVSENDPAAAVNAAVLMARTAGPVLVTHSDEVPRETAQALARMAPRQVVVIGDRRAVSDAVALQLGRYAGVLRAVPVTRVATDPRETSVAVAARYPDWVGEAYVVSLSDPAGALAAATVAARQGAPVLVTGFQLSDEVEAALARLQPEAVVVVGSPDMIGADTELRVRETLRPR